MLLKLECYWSGANVFIKPDEIIAARGLNNPAKNEYRTTLYIRGGEYLDVKVDVDKIINTEAYEIVEIK